MLEQSEREEVRNQAGADESHVDGVFMVLHRLLGILWWILILPVLTLCLIIVGYVVSLVIADAQGRTGQVQTVVVTPDSADGDSSLETREVYRDTIGSERINRMIMTLWDKALPIATEIVKLFAPILVLLLVVAGVRFLTRDAAGTTNLTRLFTDLPSVLAIIIVAAICLIPYTGVPVPEALNNIALVVVGFYFGRGRQRADSEPPAPAGSG